jgi:Heterokaryon incompatibility protein (HET)
VTTEKPSPSRGYCGPTAYFQKFGSILGSVSNFIEEDIPVQDIEPYSGRLRPLLADLRLFCKWKEICCNQHQGICDGNLDTTDFSLRLIDVDKRRIVSGCCNVSFVALSYVWGEDTEPFLTQSTEFAFQQEGSLNESILPATIYDAVLVTRGLGERYLWVDSCCIVQDDEQDKLKYVPRMDLIYGLAIVTIIATSGISVEAGLPGVRKGSRSRVQESFAAKDVQLIETLDPNGNGDSLSYIGESTWNERGWTFQERLLSRRALVFTDEQIYWECRIASWSEDSYRESPSIPTIYRHSLHDELPRQPLNADTEDFERSYRMLVEAYSARLFRNEEDYLDGFAGVLQTFERLYDEPFTWGLPQSFFSSALTWPCETSRPLAKRRVGLHSSMRAGGIITKCRFPSWSWVGWVCEVYLTQCSDELQLNATGLEFYVIDEKGHLQLILEQKAPVGGDARVPRPWKGMESMALTENIPPGLLHSPQARAALCFWSSIATLRVNHDEVQFPSQRRVYGSKNLELAARWKHLPFNLSAASNTFSAVVIGDTDTWGGHKDYLNIMLISWVEGIAYREGMLSLLESDWLRLDRTWKQITLC